MPQFKDLTENDRRAAMSTFIFPIPPVADNSIGQADRQQVQGVYSNVLAGEAVARGFDFEAWHSHYKHDKTK